MITKRNPIFCRFAWVGFAAALLLAAPFASAEEQKQFQLNEKVSEALQKFKTLQETKNYQGMMELVDSQLKVVPPTSYDAAFLLDIKAKIFLQLEQFGKAIEPWERALQLSRQHGYFDKATQQEIIKIMAQLIFSEATVVKDKQQQRALVSKSAAYLKDYLDQSQKPEPDVQMLYAQILYFQATEDQENINQAQLAEARKIVEQGMLSQIKPREGYYLLLLAILQQQNEMARAAEIMELLLSMYPQKKDVWPMLFSTYVNLASAAKPESKLQRELYVRAINAIESAQKLGFMTSQRDYYNLFTLYANAGELNIATDVLYNGMKKGLIESTPQNWRVLGQYYQISNKELQAINALKEATKLFPKDGSLEFVIGQIYQQIDNIKEANKHFRLAVEKGNLGDKPHQVYLFLSYTSFELGMLEDALAQINEAQKTPEGAKDSQIKALKDGITNAIQDREIAKELREKAAKKL